MGLINITFMKQKAIIVDLDWTLCELKEFDDRYNHTWDEKLIDYMYEELYKEWFLLDVDIIILTWRKEKFREITKSWLINNFVWFDRLIMQEGSMAKKNEVFKEEQLKELMEEYDIHMVYDDNPKVWEVCQRLSLPFNPCY